MSEWISVKKSLPIEEGYFFVCGAGQVGISYYADGGHWLGDDDEQESDKVEFWQPLPFPPVN